MFKKKLPATANKIEYEMKALKDFLELEVCEKITGKIIAKIDEQNARIEEQNELYRRIDAKLSDLIKLMADEKKSE